MNFQRFSSLFATVAIAALLVATGYCLWQLWELRQEHKQLLQIEAMTRQRLNEQQDALRENERKLERLRTDAAYVELVMRQRLGYAKPGELIFRFENTETQNPLIGTGSLPPLR